MSLFLQSAAKLPAILDVLDELQRVEVAVTKLRHICAEGDAVDRLVATVAACTGKGASGLALLEWAYDRILEGHDPERIERLLDARVR